MPRLSNQNIIGDAGLTTSGQGVDVNETRLTGTIKFNASITPNFAVLALIFSLFLYFKNSLSLFLEYDIDSILATVSYIVPARVLHILCDVSHAHHTNPTNFMVSVAKPYGSDIAKYINSLIYNILSII